VATWKIIVMIVLAPFALAFVVMMIEQLILFFEEIFGQW